MDMYYLATVLPMMVCLVWTAVFLLDYRKNDPARRMLAVFGIASTLLYACHYLHFNQLDNTFSDSLYFLCNLSVYPIYNLYVRRLTRPGWKLTPRSLLWFLPAMLVFLWSISGLSAKYGGPKTGFVVQLLFPLVSVAASVDALLQLIRFRRLAGDFYSGAEESRLDPIFVLIGIQLFTTVASFVINFVGRKAFEGSDSLIIPSLFFAILLFGIFYIGNSTDVLAEEMNQEPKPLLQADNQHGFSEEQQKQLMEKIEWQIRDRQLFRTKGLTIAELAEAVGSNRSYVSYCINTFTGSSFSEYINKARVNYVLELMAGDEQLTLTEIADRAGFTERTSFYRAFKKVVGMSPSTYIARQ